jgi:hypothetical protein
MMGVMNPSLIASIQRSSIFLATLCNHSRNLLKAGIVALGVKRGFLLFLDFSLLLSPPLFCSSFVFFPFSYRLCVSYHNNCRGNNSNSTLTFGAVARGFGGLFRGLFKGFFVFACFCTGVSREGFTPRWLPIFGAIFVTILSRE